MYRHVRSELTLPHPMGLVYADLEVRRERGPSCNVRFLVDSGATLSVLPWQVWHPLGIDAPSPVVLGQRRDTALLGTLTLEALGLVLNPFERTLRPMRMMLAS